MANKNIPLSDKQLVTERSPLYRLAGKKKDTEVSGNSLLVQQVRNCYSLIRDEIVRWREILAVPYQEYLMRK